MRALARILLPTFVRRSFVRTLRRNGYQLVNLEKLYAFDGLHTVHNPVFQGDVRFQAAYRRGMRAGRGVDPCSQWRIHIGLWAASLAARAEGDFVECGVNAGFFSSAVMQYLDWNQLHKTFYLIDTFEGPVLEQYSPEEAALGRVEVAAQAMASGAYVTDLARIRENFAEWPRVEIVPGRVPEILAGLDIGQIAFLHLDMNCAFPEVAALRALWDRVSEGGVVLLDDYAYFGYEAQGKAIAREAVALGAEILTMPTGQGLIVKSGANPVRQSEKHARQVPPGADQK